MYVYVIKVWGLETSGPASLPSRALIPLPAQNYYHICVYLIILYIYMYMSM